MHREINSLLSQSFNLQGATTDFSQEAVAQAEGIIQFAKEQADAMRVSDLESAGAELSDQLLSRFNFLDAGAIESLVNYIFLMVWR